jgi:hypothetical protein
MFAAHEVMIEARYGVAAARLIRLINWGALRRASEAAYEGGLEAVIRVGPFGGARGLSKLVRVRVLDPVRRGAVMTVSLRWEATGVAGELFPVLDADLTLMSEGDDRSRLGLIGSYRPPFGRAGAALDRAIMGRVAAATIQSLLDGVAAAIADPAPNPQLGADTALRWRPITEPSES